MTILLPIVLAMSACAILLKYVPLLAWAPAAAAMAYEAKYGSGQVSYLFPLVMFSALGVGRFFKWLPGGWSQP